MRKNLITLAVLFLSFITAFAQDSIIYPHLKRGIYYSLEEIKNNSPKYEGAFMLLERTKGDILMWGGGKYGFDIVGDVNTKRLYKEVIGISNGREFYISDYVIRRGAKGFNLCYLSGPFVIVNYMTSAAKYTGGGLIPSLIKVQGGSIVDLYNADLLPLNNHSINKILSRYPGIAKEYPKKRNRIHFAAEILEKINAEIKSKAK